LEVVRALLNTWRIPNETRQPIDLLPELSRRATRWHTELPGLSRPRSASRLDSLTGLRDGLRGMVERGRPGPRDVRWLQERLRRQPVAVSVRTGALGVQVSFGRPGRRPAEEAVLAAVLTALHSGDWHRLKACPDCRWVFYDHTRSATKRWCGMTAVGPRGRACGSIAKVRAYRSRRAAQHAVAGASTTSVP
jgi:predicted RNA-binding Zn ribbon-like protein